MTHVDVSEKIDGVNPLCGRRYTVGETFYHSPLDKLSEFGKAADITCPVCADVLKRVKAGQTPADAVTASVKASPSRIAPTAAPSKLSRVFAASDPVLLKGRGHRPTVNSSLNQDLPLSTEGSVKAAITIPPTASRAPARECGQPGTVRHADEGKSITKPA